MSAQSLKKLPMKEDHRDRSSNGPNTKYDDPPNSRLFIVCGRQITEDQFKEGFGVYGKIEEIWLVKDRVSKAPKGITYIKVKRRPHSVFKSHLIAMQQSFPQLVTMFQVVFIAPIYNRLFAR